MTANCVTFQNPGTLDLRALKTFGVNVKENDNPIGFFGTGLKYAIAILLRTGHQIEVWRGMERHVLSSKKTLIRGKLFSIVTLDDEELGLTTDVGKTWEVWMALRELESNARDEKGFSSRLELQPKANFTTIRVYGEAMYDAYENLDEIFIPASTRRLWSNAHLEILDKRTSSIYYRGIRVATLQKPALFTYNILYKMDLTEDRTLKYDWLAKGRVAWSLQNCENERVLRTVLVAHKDFYEHDFDYGARDATENFLRIVGDCLKAKLHINQSAKTVYLNSRSDTQEYEPFALSPAHREMLDWAIAVLHKLKCKPERYEIHCVESIGQHIMGRAIRNEAKILLSSECFRLGHRYVASTLLEEYIHLAHSLDDCTRGLQDHLFNLVIDLVCGEEKPELDQPLERPVSPLDDTVPF